jgi:3-carboxy-cis,cis-muconate cycloisomerase
MSELLDPLFGDPEISAIFAPRGQLQALLDVEVALAEALAGAGAIPEGAVGPIRAAARAELYDPAEIAAGAARAGNLVIPLVRALTARVEGTDAAAARFVHWGATSQDVLDTALVLQLRAALPVLVGSIRRAADAAADHARRHAGTPMAGRTWLQQATPITFGLKAAGWCETLDRAAGRLEESLARASVLQLGGAAGTLAALGDHALPVASAMARALELTLPPAPWHAHRDRLADLASALGIATGGLGKIGRDLGLLAQTEVAEAFEAAPGGSSTMPQKRNPVGAAVALAAAIRTPGLVATMLGAMSQEHERAMGGWQAEWETLPELVRLTGGAARAVAQALETLVVDPSRMRANLGLTRGLIAAEAAGMALGATLGRARAHDLVQAASVRAAAEGRPLAEILAEAPEVRDRWSRADLDRLLDPERYLGSAEALVARVLAARGTAGRTSGHRERGADG